LWNNVTSYNIGMSFIAANNNTISWNNATGTLCGVYLNSARNNTMTWNNATGGTNGLRMDTMSNNNTAFLNRISGSNPAVDEGSADNRWDNGSRGNLYSDYRSRYPTAWHNHVYWDTPYNVTGSTNSTDLFPLYAPIGLEPVASFRPYLPLSFEGQWNQFEFTGVAGDAPVRYVWDFGDGSGSTDLDACHYYTSPGTYTVTLTVIDTDRDYNVVTMTIVVTAGNSWWLLILLIAAICILALAIRQHNKKKRGKEPVKKTKKVKEKR
jgi:PKD repeat protein